MDIERVNKLIDQADIAKDEAKQAKLIADACKAEEIFGLDELEEYANKMRQKALVKVEDYHF